MNRQVLLSVVGAVVATVLVVAGAAAMLRGGAVSEVSSGASEASESVASESVEAPVPPRPDCAPGGVGGVDLPCLGGAEVGERPAADAVRVVNVWAWWCDPCRRELPVLDQFAAANPQYEVVGVHADPDAARGAALLDELGVALASYQDDTGRFAGELGLPGVVPITLVLSLIHISEPTRRS